MHKKKKKPSYNNGENKKNKLYDTSLLKPSAKMPTIIFLFCSLYFKWKWSVPFETRSGFLSSNGNGPVAFLTRLLIEKTKESPQYN
jgi:hypothetical protein